MKTEVTFRYKQKLHREVVNCLNPSSGGAQLFHKFPHLDRDKVTILQCIGGTVIRKGDFTTTHHRNLPPQ